MSKHRDEDIVETLEKEIKELKSIIRGLQKQLKKEQKRQKCEHSDEDYFTEEVTNKTKKVTCPDCGEGELQSTKLGSRLLVSCVACSYRKTIKTKDGKEEKEV